MEEEKNNLRWLVPTWKGAERDRKCGIGKIPLLQTTVDEVRKASSLENRENGV